MRLLWGFCSHIKPIWKLDRITRQNDQRRHQKEQAKKTDIKTTTIEGKEDKEQEVTVPSKEIDLPFRFSL
jgi:hypothetical protein